MASPVAVISNPADPKSHLLFFLNGSTQQLAMEVRPIDGGSYTSFQNNGPATGSIVVNPLAIVLKKNVPTVYGTSQPGGKTGPVYVSTVSPYYNPISTDQSAQTTTPGLAACSDADENDWVYYLRVPEGQVTFQVTEFLVNGVNTEAAPSWKMTSASKNSNLAAVYFGATQERFVMYANTDDDRFLYWVNSNNMSPNPIQTTSGIIDGSPLAVTTVEGSDSNGPYLNIFLYYMDQNKHLNRVSGRASGSQITWFQSNVVTGASKMASTTDMTAATTGTVNYIYYIKDGHSTFDAFRDPIQASWFTPPPKEDSSSTTQQHYHHRHKHHE